MKTTFEEALEILENSHNQELNELKTENNNLRTEIEELQRENNILNTKIEQLQRENQQLKQTQNLNKPQHTEPTTSTVDETPLTINSNENEVVDSFDNMGLDINLLRGIYAYGFAKPSDIQQRAIVPLAQGRDIIAKSQSGTGKTATFIIGALQRQDHTKTECQTLILSPTRELALATRQIVISVGKHVGVKCHSCVGGTSVGEDIPILKAGVHTVIGTPGRVLDLLTRGHLDVEHIKTFILDEADEMLCRGFKDQISEIFTALPKGVQVCLFSGTLPQEVLEITQKFTNDPVQIVVPKNELTLDGVKQFYVEIEKEEWKLETLFDLLEMTTVHAVIYCNNRRKVEWLIEELKKKDIIVSSFHGETSSQERELILDEFRNSIGNRVLITTGLFTGVVDSDRYQFPLVINYDLPMNLENYLQRIGRRGCYGRKGAAINFVTAENPHIIRDLEEFFCTQIQELPVNFFDLL